ncbi:hypothetical protein BT69DRAFT_1280295 [Atractiella rhizophila]|nr:hypothetical protein BT69DRAFT_1283291 [Atractiella rhizophila]KAH8924807.1 hypothetical protein BT69DRAFT_1280295 [Atractiella rhizophila]
MAPLIEYDAPTQTRTYLTPSATSRKPDPQIGNPTKKRRTANDEVPIDDSLQADGSNLGDDGQELPQSLLSSIEIKRRQNTLAARRSRARKQEHVKSLEDEVNKLMHERDAWKQKAEKFEEELRRVTGAGALGESGLQ